MMVSEAPDDVRKPGQALFRLPADLLPDIRDRHDVLCIGRSEHALAYLHDLVAQALEGNRTVAPFYSR